MIRLLQCLFLSLLLPLAHTFGILDVIVQRAAGRSHERIGSGLTKVEEGSEAVVLSRRRQLVGAAVLLPFIAAGTPPARADVSDGNVLPKGAQQFARVVKLKTDLKVPVQNVAPLSRLH
jgi:hypothetical protein